MEKILIVENENKGRMNLLRNTLEEFGYSVRTAPMGSVTVDFIKATKPDLVILDIRRYFINGILVLSRIGQIFPDMPVIICALDIGFKKGCRQLMCKGKFFSYLIEPILPEKIISEVQRAIHESLTKSTLYH